MEEIFELISREIIKSGYDGFISSGIVLTGGTSAMEGVVELAEQVFNLPTRRGVPTGVTGLIDVVRSPMYSTGVGLVLYAKRYGEGTQFKRNGENLFGKMLERMKGWIKEFF
jgi:cell division protein FtsA